MTDRLQIGDLTPFSTVDYPGNLSAVVYTTGCPLRCPYCHNPELLARLPSNPLTEEAFWTWLASRQGLLDAVVFSGGEPLLQRGLPEALRQIAFLGFKTGLHTSGIYPERLQESLPHLTWVGLDFKAPLDRYSALTGVPGSGNRFRLALESLLVSGRAYELRTTVHPALLGPADLFWMAAFLRDHGVQRWALQAFQPQGCLNTALTGTSQPAWTEWSLEALRKFVPELVLRR